MTIILGSLDAKKIPRVASTDPHSPINELLSAMLSQTSDALPHLVAADVTARNAYWGSPANATARRALQDRGATTLRLDTGWTERYYAGLTDGGSNPGGQVTPGWYPIAGRMPIARLTKTSGAAQSTHGTPGTRTAVTFDVETFDSAGMHSTATDTSRITAVAPGLMHCNAIVRGNTTTGTLTIQFAKNGTVLPETARYGLGNATQTPLVGISAYIDVATGDYIEVFVESNTATVALTVANCLFEAALIGPR